MLVVNSLAVMQGNGGNFQERELTVKCRYQEFGGGEDNDVAVTVEGIT